eukprot:ANDGO_02598.mRNA.1 hypothetical protein
MAGASTTDHLEALSQLEKRSAELADSYLHLTGSLQSSLKAVTTILSQHSRLFVEECSEVAGSVDDAVSSMQELISHSQKLRDEMQPVEELHDEVLNVKRLLDDLEVALMQPLSAPGLPKSDAKR